MNVRSLFRSGAALALLIAAGLGTAAYAEDLLEVARPKDFKSDMNLWGTFLKDAFFKDANIIEDKTVIDMTAPYRAEDASLTPVTITAQIPQTPERYIETIYVVVDNNPQPLVGTFHMTPDMGKADLAMRIRIDQYSNVRAIAVLNDGKHHMVSSYVKASGGCSDPFGGDIYEALKVAGKIKFRTVGEMLADKPTVGQFSVSHPNFTGMSVNQRTGNIVPPHYVNKLTLTYNDKLIMSAETGISISTDPSYRFFFIPGEGGTLRAEVEDSKGNKYTETFDVSETVAKHG
ncbi:MAG: quinoprotein dehydrogenase-associated SoxYZ-like carrier [Chromatiales bacterium]